jgi:hypothetical protein
MHGLVLSLERSPLQPVGYTKFWQRHKLLVMMFEDEESLSVGDYGTVIGESDS